MCTCLCSDMASSWQVRGYGFQGFSNCCLCLKTQWVWSNSWNKECFLLYLHQLWHLRKKTSSMFDYFQSHKLVPNDSISLCLHNQNLGIWCMKPHDTKHPEISGARFPLTLYDGDLNVILFFWKILEWGTESTLKLILPQMFVTEVSFYHKFWLKCITEH